MPTKEEIEKLRFEHSWRHSVEICPKLSGEGGFESEKDVIDFCLKCPDRKSGGCPVLEVPKPFFFVKVPNDSCKFNTGYGTCRNPYHPKYNETVREKRNFPPCNYKDCPAPKISLGEK